MEESYIIEIQNEYNKIDNKWLTIHYKTSVGLVIFAFLIECLIGWFMCNTDELHTTIPMFLFKFLIMPSVLNAVCIFIAYNVIHSISIPQERKTYIISLLAVVICFVIFTVHVAFSALYFIFLVPILLTMIYCNYKLTTITFISSIAAVIISELYLKWDIDKVSIMDDSIRFGDFIITLFILVAFWAISMVVIRFEREKNAASIQKEIERQQLQQRLQRDELTGIYNRIALRKAIKDMEEDEFNNSYIFAMIDLDNFKNLNDSLGHLMGDHYLIEFSKVLRANCGDAVPFRYGGDEFCVLFCNRTSNDIVETFERIQKDMKEINVDNKAEVSVTASIGISTYSKGMVTSSLVINADKALYEAKTVKNKICIYNDSSLSSI